MRFFFGHDYLFSFTPPKFLVFDLFNAKVDSGMERRKIRQLEIGCLSNNEIATYSKEVIIIPFHFLVRV